jgi:uncharacterized protein
MLFLSAGLGLAVGLVIGALGGGGGVLTVPLLVYVLGLPAQDATTSSIIIIGVTALVGTLARIRSRTVDWRTGLVLGALGVPAAYAGTLLNHGVDQRVLLLAFAAVTIVAAAAMLLNRGPDEPAPAAGTVITRTRAGTATKVVLSGLVVGFLTGFLGVGGGFLAVPALVIVLRMPMAAAVGTSLFVITLNAVSSMASRLGTHLDLDWRIVVPFTVLAVAGCLAGKRVANRFSGDELTRGFAVMLILVGGSVAAQALGLF